MPLTTLTPLPSQRTIGSIAQEIRRDWGPKVNYAAKPYLDAMLYLRDSTSMHGADDAKSVVIYFLANASSYRTVNAKRLKTELKAHFPGMK